MGAHAGYRLRTIGLLFVRDDRVLILFSHIGGMGAAFSPSRRAVHRLITTLSGLVSLVVTPILYCVLTLLYYDLRVRKEAVRSRDARRAASRRVAPTRADPIGLAAPRARLSLRSSAYAGGLMTATTERGGALVERSHPWIAQLGGESRGYRLFVAVLVAVLVGNSAALRSGCSFERFAARRSLGTAKPSRLQSARRDAAWHLRSADELASAGRCREALQRAFVGVAVRLEEAGTSDVPSEPYSCRDRPGARVAPADGARLRSLVQSLYAACSEAARAVSPSITHGAPSPTRSGMRPRTELAIALGLVGAVE